MSNGHPLEEMSCHGNEFKELIVNGDSGIWGDTVNIASRMEANSEPGKVNLSEATHIEIKGEFSCDYRGEVEVKSRGH